MTQKQILVMYDGKVVGKHQLDMLIEEQLVVELKAVNGLEAIHFAQLRSYLKAANLSVGLLMNFNSPTLVVKRIVN